jgi:hypothetical protein
MERKQKRKKLGEWPADVRCPLKSENRPTQLGATVDI